MRSHHKKHLLRSERGIALITAILATSLLLALALLIITMATKDLRVSTTTMVGRHSMTTAEQALQEAIREFSPTDSTSKNATGTAINNSSWTYEVTDPTSGLTTAIPPYGFSSDWAVDVYDVTVTGSTKDAETGIVAGMGFMRPSGP